MARVSSLSARDIVILRDTQVPSPQDQRKILDQINLSLEELKHAAVLVEIAPEKFSRPHSAEVYWLGIKALRDAARDLADLASEALALKDAYLDKEDTA